MEGVADDMISPLLPTSHETKRRSSFLSFSCCGKKHYAKCSEVNITNTLEKTKTIPLSHNDEFFAPVIIYGLWVLDAHLDESVLVSVLGCLIHEFPTLR
jgi:hypothetical protein